MAHCDADRMQQVFWNLLSNGVKFTPRGGVVAATLTAQRHSVLDHRDRHRHWHPS